MNRLDIDFENSLNPDQLAAVTAPPDRPALVLAGAGSGKTRTLTYRVAWLISERGISPKRILLLTFTNKAAAEMLGRIERLTGYGASDFWGGTFHSIGCRFLRVHAEKLGLEKNFTILDADDAEKLVKTAAEKLFPKFFSSKINPKAGLLAEIISYARNTMGGVAHAMMERFPWIETPAAQIEEIARAYAAAKLASNTCDFDDMLELWLRLLRENPDIADYYRKRFENILVDEYQDTNRLQSAILDELADRGQISAVGDDAQCIYSWRGAAIENILTFKDRYPAAGIYKIERNYRSSARILDFANQILSQMPVSGDYRKSLVAAKEGFHKPVVLSALDGGSQGRLVSELIREIAEGGKYTYSDIAVLYRSHFQAMDLQLQLQYKNIPFVITSGLKFFEQAHIRDIVAQIKFAANGKDFASFSRFVRFLEKIGEKTALKIYDAARAAAAKKGISIYAALRLDAVAAKVPAVSRPAFAEMAESMEKIAAGVCAASGGQGGAAEAQMSLFGESGGIPAPAASSEIYPEEIVRQACSGWYKNAMMRAYEDYPERAKDFDALLEYASKYRDFNDFLANITLEVSEARADSGEQGPERVRLMTVHQAKGLEFPVVFIIGAADGLFPTNRSIEDGDVEEERRLFYVAATRAMEHLIITYPKVCVVAGEPQMRPKSRFLEQISHECYSSSL